MDEELIRQYLSTSQAAHTAGGLAVAQSIILKHMAQHEDVKIRLALLQVMDEIADFLQELE